MRVVLHVGAHKTGTSLIQKYFKEHEQAVREVGVSLITRLDASEMVGWGNKPPELLRSRLEDEAAKQPPVVLMSLENPMGRPFQPDRAGLYPDASRGAEGLAKACAGFDTYIVYYVRPIAEFLESYYLQTIHQGKWHTFGEWYDSLIGPHRWTPTVEALEHAFGAERVILGDFAEIRAGQNQFLRQFMTRAGLPQPPTVEYETVRNASISARGLDIALAINPHLQDAKERRMTRVFLQQHFSNQVEERARPMPEELRRSITEDTAAEFEALAARAAADLATPRVPAPDPRPLPVDPPSPSVAGGRRRGSLKRRAGQLARRIRAPRD